MGQLDYDVVYLTKESLDEIEGKLRRCCAGRWGLQLLDCNDGERVKTFRVEFERESDISVLCQPDTAYA